MCLEFILDYFGRGSSSGAYSWFDLGRAIIDKARCIIIIPTSLPLHPLRRRF